MKRWSHCASLSLLTFAFLLSMSGLAQVVQSPVTAQYSATLNRYCVTCHSDKLKTANLSLETIDVANVAAHRELWEKVVRKLRSASMPPAGAPRPGKQFYEQFADYLERSLDQSFAAN